MILTKNKTIDLVITILFSILFIGAILSLKNSVSAHPVDVSYLNIFIEEDSDGNQISETEAVLDIRSNWIQISALIEDFEETEDFEQQFRDRESNISDYFNKNIQFENNGSDCELEYVTADVMDPEEILLRGVPTNFRVTCPDEISKIDLEVTLFTATSPLQTNIVFAYTTPSELLITSQLNVSNTQMIINVAEPSENRSSSNSQNIISQTVNNSFLERLPDNLENLTFLSLAILIGISVIVGGLHAMEGGHSKLILASLLLNKKIDVKKGIVFVFIFTLTHLADIFIVAIALLLASSISDIYEQMNYLQVFAIYAMLFISASLVLKEIGNVLKRIYIRRINRKPVQEPLTSDVFEENIQNHHEDSHLHGGGHHHHHFDLDKNNSFRQQVMLAFLEGLAPCLTGWTILMLIISSGNMWLIFPVLISFGVGVFIVLLIFMLLVNRFRNVVYRKVSFISEISPLLSAIILLLTALYFLL